MGKALFYKKPKKDFIQCLACYHFCLIEKGGRGFCGVRKNHNGKLKLLVKNKPIAINIDPIEKKPLFHFSPGEKAFSLGTLGCNFSCEFCQNWDISQEPKNKDEKSIYWGENWPPKKIIDYCQKNDLKVIAYTYNEPTIWVEYALEIMKRAKKKKIKNVWVSNGFMSEKTIKEMAPYLDAINIDLKSFSDEFYQKICQGKLTPVKENIRKIYQLGIWVEITTLIIPGLNDSENEIKEIANFLKSISPNIVWHLSAFYPAYKMLDHKITPTEILFKAYQIGKEAGLKYIYTGNIPNLETESTYCPNCQKMVIQRLGIQLIENKLIKNKCPFCGYKIEGIFE
ncbi:MAG: AmmeMemoRadiSam system radical SAM enzyme [Minisyncoccia bacterium]